MGLIGGLEPGGFGFLGFPYERDCYLRVPLESQTANWKPSISINHWLTAHAGWNITFCFFVFFSGASCLVFGTNTLLTANTGSTNYSKQSTTTFWPAVDLPGKAKIRSLPAIKAYPPKNWPDFVKRHSEHHLWLKNIDFFVDGDVNWIFHVFTWKNGVFAPTFHPSKHGCLANQPTPL